MLSPVSFTAWLSSATVHSTEYVQRWLKEDAKLKWGLYTKLLSTKRAKIGKYALENAIVAAAMHYSKELQKLLNESTEIPVERIFNWRQTGLNRIPSSNWTTELRGSKRVELAGLSDKWQITAVLCGSFTGDFLPPQVVYQGKTNRWHSTCDFQSDWHITHWPNHWSNESTMVDYIQQIIVAYII